MNSSLQIYIYIQYINMYNINLWAFFLLVIRTILTWLVSDEPLKLQYREVEKVPSTELFNPLGEFRQLVITCYTAQYIYYIS